jgi:modulator of FtsH protease
MVSYEPQQWHDLFVAVADASRGLAGLIFVAVSLNHEQILSLPSLPPLAARSVSVLVALMLMSIFGLAPGQTYELLGIEILALGVVLLVGVVTVTLRGMSKTTPLRWKINLLSLALVSTVPMVIAGASTTLGVGGGLNWALADIVCGYIVSIYSAWILLIEIRR